MIYNFSDFLNLLTMYRYYRYFSLNSDAVIIGILSFLAASAFPVSSSCVLAITTKVFLIQN